MALWASPLDRHVAVGDYFFIGEAVIIDSNRDRQRERIVRCTRVVALISIEMILLLQTSAPVFLTLLFDSGPGVNPH
jgi:hypothetical protein